MPVINLPIEQRAFDINRRIFYKSTAEQKNDSFLT